MSKSHVVSAVVVLAFVVCGSVAGAQPLGTFRWQQMPYCNVITVNVVQNGSIYHLDGTDNQCGVARLASVTGLGFVNPNGTIGLGLTMVTNDGSASGGAPMHLDVVLDLSVNGTWRDNSGQSGPFAFLVGAPTAGPPRPAPVPAFTGGLAAGGARITNVGAPSVTSDAANKGYVDTNVRAALIGEKIWKGFVGSTGTKASTGPFTASRSAPGQYQVDVDVTGLGLPTSFPLGVVTSFSNSERAQINGYGFAAPGGALTRITLVVRTLNTAGVATDSSFMFMLAMPDADSGSPVPPFDQASGAAGMTCTTVGDTTTCMLPPG